MSSQIGTHTLTGSNREYIYRDQRIGTGAYSVVYKGICRNTKEPVAIKKIDLRRFKDDKARIDEEIEIMKKLKHIGIVQLYDVIYDKLNDYVYIIMEYCSGGDLSTIIHQSTEAEIQRYFQQLAEAFKYLFKQKILHRDIKPQNILFKDPSRKILKITDFGFSKYYNEDNTLLETLCGSPMYMAPEILFHQKYNVKTDLWSIGVILYEMVYGKYPYSAKTTIDLIKEVKSGKIEFSKNTKVKVSSQCIDLLQKLLKKDPIIRITWTEFFEHPWVYTGNNVDVGSEYDVIKGVKSTMAYPMGIPRSKPIPIRGQTKSNECAPLGFSNYIIDDYCLSTPKELPQLKLDTTNTPEQEVPMKSNILEYMNISMELIKSLTQVSFQSI
jgi:serine/threonine-protein kinase ULK/ATG1